ncbi:unnamed protein product [Vitrella brassicaformis CCMP3155]|uniref:Uncharacterized protein n=1 Tax=Vitrella brassicaformis (strain CCMP3155) TaxID=1169540 RepID=A0A0G4E8P5_VITBC|nr:unnamed protein product [Vitrella brassicaformis CCMP3155]|eukprot:CEL91737.1 unnamed protein product [Vitrella brassicaformis CCMP3155]
MEVEAVGDNNDGMQSPLPAPPAPSNLLSSSNDNGGLGGVTAGSPSGGNHQGAAAVADVLPGSASSSAQGKSNLETLMEGAMSATDVYVKFVDFIETVNPSPSRIQEWVELNKVDIKKQTAAAYHAIHSHSAIVFEERFFYRMWIGAYQWGVEQPIKDYTTVVILDERLKGHELWEGKEAFCRWFAVLLDNKFKSYENYHYKMAGASQLRANQAYPAYRVSVAYLKTDWGLSTGEKLVFHTDAYVVDFKNEIFHADWDPLSAAYYRTIKDSISLFKSQHNITSKTQLTPVSEYLAQVSSRFPGLIPFRQGSNKFAAFTPLPAEWIEKEFKSIPIDHPDLQKAIHIRQPGCAFGMVNDEFESATMPLEHMGDLTSILGSHVYSIARDAHKSINSYGELLLRKPSDPIRVAFEEKHAWRFLHVLSSISAGMQKGLFNNNTEERMVNLMKSTIEKLELVTTSTAGY